MTFEFTMLFHQTRSLTTKRHCSPQRNGPNHFKRLFIRQSTTAATLLSLCTIDSPTPTDLSPNGLTSIIVSEMMEAADERTGETQNGTNPLLLWTWHGK